MWVSRFLLLAALLCLTIPMSGCGQSNMSGTADAPDVEEPELSEEEEAAEEAYLQQSQQ